MDKRPLWFPIVMVCAIGLLLTLFLLRLNLGGDAERTPLNDTVGPLMENTRTFRLARHCVVIVYSYANATYISIKDTAAEGSGVVLTPKQFHHLRRQIPSIAKAVGEFRHGQMS